jgi:C_GCAxxG_C_C family probable redox protein
MSSITEKAVATFSQEYNCCQAVLSAFAPSLGLDKDLSLRLGTGFPGGMGYRGGTCGAIMGAYLVLGLIAGNSKANDEPRKEMTYGLIQEFITQFKAKHKHTTCNNLLNIDIETREGYRKALECGSFSKQCSEFVRDASLILENLVKTYTERKSAPYFNAIATKWDQMQQSFFSERIRNQVLSFVNLTEGMTVADIGAGSGYMTEGLISSPVNILAVDQSDEMLKVMESKFGITGKVTYLKGESAGLPIQDQQVDYTFANMYLHHVDDPLVAIRELYRILKPGGTSIITDLESHPYEFLRTEQFDKWLGFDLSDIRKWHEDAGFKNIRVSGTGEKCCTESGSSVKR